MYEQIINYIMAILPAASTITASIVMFFRIIGRTREMTSSLKDDTEKKMEEAMREQYAQMEVLKAAVQKVTDSNEIAQIKEQYKRLQAEMEETNRLNAELLAQLKMRY